MQPQRSLSTTPASAVINAIDTHPALSTRGGDSARRLWRVLAERANYRTGVVRASEAELAQAIGKPRRDSLWASKGSPGPMDRLLAIGAVVRDGDELWLYRNPADVDTPKAAAPPDPQTLLIADVDDAPPPDTLPIPGVPLDSRNSNGGRGGWSAQTVSIPKQEEQENSCSSYSSEQRESRGTPATWPTVRHRLVELGAYAPSKIVAHIREVGGRPSDLMGLCDYYATNPDQLNIDGGALRVACLEWLPGMEYGAPGLWPQVKRLTTSSNRKTKRELEEEHEFARELRFIQLRKELGPTNRKQINVVLVREGFMPVAVVERTTPHEE